MQFYKRRTAIIVKRILLIFFAITAIGLIIPQNFQMPVSGAGYKSYDQRSFWAYPWGKSVTHKGVDIFAKKGTNIHPATPGFVIYRGYNKLGGKVVLVLGPKWRMHYYAHLDTIQTKMFSLVGHSSVIGKVGTTGNAVGKAPHLHYTIKTLLPYPWLKDGGIQGWRKMFFLNPVEFLNSALKKKE